MDGAISVSKGCFVYKNSRVPKDSKTQKLQSQGKPNTVDQSNHQIYIKTLAAVIADIEMLKEEIFSTPLPHLLTYVKNAYKTEKRIQDILPSAVLLTGINQHDHQAQFIMVAKHIEEKTSSIVCMLQIRDCVSVKNAIETMTFSFLNKTNDLVAEDHRDSKLKRSRCTMNILCARYNLLNGNRNLVVILPELECINLEMFQDFVLILHLYSSKIPIVLIFGIATVISLLHNTLPYHIISKLDLKIFKTQSTTVAMDQIFEKVIISPKFSFHLSSKAINLLSHIFTCYDFSLEGLIQGFKYCAMEHFLQSNIYALCTDYSESLDFIKSLSHMNLEGIRQMMSFRQFIESLTDCRKVIAFLTDDEYLKRKLPTLLRACHMHFINFRIFVEFLTIMVNDLPKHPMGTLRWKIYETCLSTNILENPDFKQCWQIISLMSKDAFVSKISNAILLTRQFLDDEISPLEFGQSCQLETNKKLSVLKSLLKKVQVLEPGIKINPSDSRSMEMQNLSRHSLKANLLQLATQDKSNPELRKAMNQVLEYIRIEMIGKYLLSLKYAPPLHEIFVSEDASTIRRNIVGAPRAALHHALNDPHIYLQCNCCVLEEETQIVKTLPDLSLAYKLHLECSRIINLFDWLQAFRIVVDTSEGDNEQIEPETQARFARAVAELVFLGYIKTSKRKTDHVARLTW